tara:strand:- start:6617 stop:6853 length:237 start_codon:yes stop_codon:yes gene_type:complete
MSNNKKTQKKQAKPTRFKLQTHKARFDMNLEKLDEHYTAAMKAQALQYRKYKEAQTYAADTAALLETKKKLYMEKLND